MSRFSHIEDQARAEEWIARICSGDERALEEMVRVCYAPVASFAYRYTRSREIAEEVAQDVFVRIWDRRSNLEISGNLIAYLFTTARNIAINATNRVSERSIVVDESEADALHSDMGMGDIDLDAHELSHTLRKALNNLAPRGREVFLLSRRDGLTPGQIAQVLGINVQTVYTLLGRALKELQKAIEV